MDSLTRFSMAANAFRGKGMGPWSSTEDFFKVLRFKFSAGKALFKARSKSLVSGRGLFSSGISGTYAMHALSIKIICNPPKSLETILLSKQNEVENLMILCL